MILLVTCFMSACDQSQADKTGADNSIIGYLPPALGEPNEITIVMDTTDWRGEFSKEMKKLLAVPYKGLNQDEGKFKMSPITPSAFNTLFRKTKNIIFVITLDNESVSGRYMKDIITPEIVDRVAKDSSRWIMIRDDKYARGQKIVYLISKDKPTLIRRLKNDGLRIKAVFEEHLNRSVERDLQSNGLNKMLMKEQAAKGFKMSLPKFFEKALDSAGFIWYRNLTRHVDANVMVYKVPYTSETIFERDSLLAFRERMTKSFLRDPEDKSFYITTQPILPMETERISRKGQYAVKFYGLWKASDGTQGGPYRGYVFLDPPKEHVYYLEAWVYAPGQSKIASIRKLESIMNSFEFLE